MKRFLKGISLLFVMLWAELCPAFSGLCEVAPNEKQPFLPVSVYHRQVNGPGESGEKPASYVCYPEFFSDDPAYDPAVKKINQTIQEKARIPEYLALLSTLQPGGTGLKMDYRNAVFSAQTLETAQFAQLSDLRYFSILINVQGKMLSGRPSQVYCPMTFDLRTGEEVPFDQLFSDPDGAKDFIEEYVSERVAPALSTYLENDQVFPVPFDRFTLDPVFGRITIYYENSQLSFLSGYSGAVTVQYSDLAPWFDLSPDGVIPQTHYYQLFVSGSEVNEREQIWSVLRDGKLIAGESIRVNSKLSDQADHLALHFTSDSDYYPGGAFLEAEESLFRGTLILTDESEDLVIGFLTDTADLYGMAPGKINLEEAILLLGREPDAQLSLDEAAAELYRVCSGTAAIYQVDGIHSPLQFTLYADENGTVQYMKLAVP